VAREGIQISYGKKDTNTIVERRLEMGAMTVCLPHNELVVDSHAFSHSYPFWINGEIKEYERVSTI
jgi:hypothetical protein